MLKKFDSIKPEYRDVGYGVSSIALTAAGLLSISTTSVAYHGISFVASTTNRVEIYIYDAINATTGNILDAIIISSGTDKQGERYTPIVAKYGITVGITGTGGKGTIYYGPKG